MKYKCLVLDHDDTTVASTATIHYPCFIEYLDKFRPGESEGWTLEEYFIKNSNPGITELLRDELGMNEEELVHEVEYWRAYVEHHIPTAYSGIADIIREFRRRGGIIAVNSHSFERYIKRDYDYNCLPYPDIVYSWDLPEEKRKPNPYSVLNLMEKFELLPSEILVVDDLQPGYEMARAAGVDFAASGWAYDIPEIESFMRAHSTYYLKTVEELSDVLFS